MSTMKPLEEKGKALRMLRRLDNVALKKLEQHCIICNLDHGGGCFYPHCQEAKQLMIKNALGGKKFGLVSYKRSGKVQKSPWLLVSSLFLERAFSWRSRVQRSRVQREDGTTTTLLMSDID